MSIPIYRRIGDEDLQAIIDRTKLPMPFVDGREQFEMGESMEPSRLGGVTGLRVEGDFIVADLEFFKSVEVHPERGLLRLALI